MKGFLKRTAAVLVCMVWLSPGALAAQQLIPVGEVIGIELTDGTVSIVAFDEILGQGAKAAGLQVGDTVVSIDDQKVSCAQDIRHALERCDAVVELSVLREGKEKQLTVKPQVTTDGPKLGVYLKQGITGVGTVTWYDPESGSFGALGHGVNAQDGKLLQMEQGTVYHAAVQSVKKGAAGEPGQLVGAMTDGTPVGKITKNTTQGIFGATASGWTGEAVPTAQKQEVKTGPATIRSTVNDTQIQEYSVEILKIYPNSDSTGRNMLLKVTDPALLSATGGIVQGMSGSPIIQDGKLIGAVTHVLVNDPTTGYGIFIENMLDATA